VISFHNPEFHEKIMKKYGRRIRKSYFSDLFFKQDFRSSGQRKLNVFVRVKFDLHNISSVKNFPLSPPKEKKRGTLFFPLELKIFGSTPLKQVSEKNVSWSPVSGKDEHGNLTYRFIILESLSSGLKNSELTTPGSMQFNFAPFRLINQKLIVSNLQPVSNLHLSNVKLLNQEASGFRGPNHFSAHSTLPNLKISKFNILKFNILKFNFLKKSSRVLISGIRNRIQMPQNDENSFLKENSLFFTQSTLPASREISTQDSGFLTSFSAYSPIHFLGACSFIRKDFNETLRKNEELKHSGRNLSGRSVLTRSSTGINDSRNSEILLALSSRSFNSIPLNRSFNSIPLNRSFNSERLEQKLKVRKKKIESNQRRQYSGVKESKEKIWEKQQIIATKEKQNLIETKKNHYTHEFNWLTAVKKDIEIVSQLNQHVPTIPSRTKAYQLKRKEKLNSGNTAVFQLNNKEKNRSENAVFSPPLHATIQQAFTTFNYEKIRSMFYIFRYLKTPKLTSEFTRITRTLKSDYQQFNPYIADSVIDYNFNFFDSRIDDVVNYNFFDFLIADIPDYRLSASYTDFNYVTYGRKIDSKRAQDWKKHTHIQINRIKNRLDQHLFFKSSKITAHRLKWAKTISFNYEKNTFQKARFAAEFLTHSLIPVPVEFLTHSLLTHSLSPVPAENSFPYKIHNKLFRKTSQVIISDTDSLFHEGAPAKRSSTETTGLKTSDELLEPSSRVFNLLFNLYSLKRKPEISKEAVKSVLRRKYSSTDRSKLKILIKTALVERKAEQGHEEPSAFRRIRNMRLIPSVQFLIQNFLEKTSLLLDYESLTDLEKPGMGQNLTYQQRKATFPYSDKKIKKTLPTGRKFSPKKAITGKNIPEKFSKDLLIFQRVYLKETIPGFPALYIQQLTSRPITLIRSSLLAGENGILRAGVSSHGATSKSGDRNIKPARSQLFSRFKIHRLPLAGNKPGHTTGTFGTDGTYMTGSQANPVQERKFGSQFAWIQKIFDFSEVSLASSRTTVKGENPAYPQKTSVLRGSSLQEPEKPEPENRKSENRKKDNITTYILEQPLIYTHEQPLIQLLSLNRAKIFKNSVFKNPVALKSSLMKKYIFNSLMVHTTGVKDIHSNLQQTLQKFGYTGGHRFRKQKASPSLGTQNLAFTDTKTSIFDLRKVYINSRQNRTIQTISAYTEILQATTALNYPTTSAQSYPALSAPFPSPLKKGFLEYHRTLYPSGTNASAATEPFSISGKIRNLIFGGNLSSNVFFSGRPSSALISSLSRIFARKLEVLSNTETESSNAENLTYKPALRSKFTLRYKPASVSQLSRAQKPDGQKVSHWKTVKMNLSPESEKQRSANTGGFLQRRSLDFLERKNNKLRVNKKIDIPAEAQRRQRFFLDFVLSSKYGFIKGMKHKKISFTTYKPEKKPEKMQDTFNGFLFRSKLPKASILKFSEKTASSRIHLRPESTDFVFPSAGEAGKPSEFTAFWPSVKGMSELKYTKGNNRETEREDLVYGTSEPLLEEVKKIKRTIFETRKIVADHLESHMLQVTGKPEQVMDIEEMSEKIMQSINRRLKIEAERRGIF